MDLNDLSNPLLRLEFQQVRHVLPAGRSGRLRQLVGLQPVHPTKIGKEQNPVVGGTHKEVPHHIVLLQLGAPHPLATAALRLIRIHLGALRIPRRRDGHHHVFAGDQVLFGHVAGGSNDLRPAIVAVLVHNLFQFIADNGALPARGSQNVLQVGNDRLDLGELINDLLAFQGCQTPQLHGENCISLHLVNGEQVNEAAAGNIHGFRPADQRNDLVQHVEGLH